MATPKKEELFTWDYGKIQKSAKIRQKWDIVAIETHDREKIQWAIENYFEPFSVTSHPKSNSLSNQIEIITTLWFKRPAHLEE
jgi:hypothetical protein